MRPLRGAMSAQISGPIFFRLGLRLGGPPGRRRAPRPWGVRSARMPIPIPPPRIVRHALPSCALARVDERPHAQHHVDESSAAMVSCAARAFMSGSMPAERA